MRTITFYSYKGGVGRTLTLANIAAYLSRFGLKVCIIDFDLEAPGVHYKFPEITYNIKNGLVDYIHDFVNNSTVPESLQGYSLQTKPTASISHCVPITLIPAGNVFSSEYWVKLSTINWNSLLYGNNGEGILFFLELKERIAREFKPDFLLIDSRTGVTEMSSLCTSILADQVVMLLANNRENIEGARQILRAIQNVELYMEKKAPAITVALTRYPIQNDTKESGKLEANRIAEITKILNEPTSGDKQFQRIEDLCVLHSDRDLELTETLRINQEQNPKETPLLKDYLKLFSKIIPNGIIENRMESIVNEIMDYSRVLSDPDKVQYELERIAEIYPHGKTLARLADFYMLRNEKREKILPLFHELWKTYGVEDEKFLSKYKTIFMKSDINSWSRPKFELAIIEKYLKNHPEEFDTILKLANAYLEEGKYRLALKNYRALLGVADQSTHQKILAKMLEVFSRVNDQDLIAEAKIFLESNKEFIDNKNEFKARKLAVLMNVGDLKYAAEMMTEKAFEHYLASEHRSLFVDAVQKLGLPGESSKKILSVAAKLARQHDFSELYDIGRTLYELGKAEEFSNILKKERHPELDRIIYELERNFRR